MSVNNYIERMQRLVADIAHGQVSPHKICMMLAVIDLARAGALNENRIIFDNPALLERYYENFNAVAKPGQHPNPYMPFYHLKGKLKGNAPSFWHIKFKEGAEEKKPRRNKDVLDNIAWAYLDDELFAILQNDADREILAGEIERYWFGQELMGLKEIVHQSQQVSEYERAIKGLTLGDRGVREVSIAIRNPAFRRVVTSEYDYRCAATHRRVLLPDGRAMVQAAHIIPVSEGADDDPRNGLALTPDIHWAMDNFLLAPGADLKWHISRRVDINDADNLSWLATLKGKPLFLPQNPQFHPKKDALAWRLEEMKQRDSAA